MFTPTKAGIEYCPLVDENGKDLLSFPGELKSSDDQKSPLTAVINNKPSFAHVEVTLNGNAVVGDYGAMLWIHAGQNAIAINTWCHMGGDTCGSTCMGGFCASYWRTCASEGKCMNEFSGAGQVSFGFDLPGDMISMSCTTNEGWILTKGVFICGTNNLCVSGRFTDCCTCCFSGEGGFLTHVTTQSNEGNIFFAGGFGCVQKQRVPDGCVLAVNTGMFFAAPDSVPIHVGIPGGCCELCCSGEGFVMKFRGPCVLYTQNRDPAVFEQLLSPQYNQAGGGGGDAGAGGGA